MRKILMSILCGLSISGFSQSKPVMVEIVSEDSVFRLLRDGKPYFVNGAGGIAHMSRIPAAGGNSIRTWGTANGQKILDSAHRYGLTVLMGLNVARERHGFDYNDTAAVAKQLSELRKEVLKYKDHPALLGWGIGNELNLHYTNPKVWNAVNDISKMIHELDKNHPVATVLAGINQKEIDYINQHCTDIDFLGINTYGDLAGLPARVKRVGWKGPYIVTEWGPTGHWECLTTAWNQPIEETSSEKAHVYKTRYQYSIEADKKNCLGSYVFLWGQKQERTPTWYGIFTEKGEETEVVDVMQFLWSGKWPENMAPHIYSLQVNEKKASQNVYLEPGKEYNVKAIAFDPEKKPLMYRWEVLPEPTKVGEGGDREDRPAPVTNAVTEKGSGGGMFRTPSQKGAYRVFVYVTDGNNNVATANVPVYVQ
jgi:hypothetical protein